MPELNIDSATIFWGFSCCVGIVVFGLSLLYYMTRQ